jgi:tetratricopeptide (TPR) repeat protein
MIRPYLRWRTIAYGGPALVLAWLIVSRSFAAYFADTAPQLALWLNPSQPQALLNLGQSTLRPAAAAGKQIEANESPAPKLSADESTGSIDAMAGGPEVSQDMDQAFKVLDQSQTIDLAAVRSWAEAALINEPLNAQALGILGQIASARGDEGSAEKLMRAAARLSLHDDVAFYWLMIKSMQAGDYQSAVDDADVLLRTNPELVDYVAPVLAKIAEDKGSATMLEAVLARDPPWRDAFFQAFPIYVTDARTPLNLLLALRSTPVPPTSSDFARYVNILVGRKYYDLAYYTWLQFLPIRELRNAGPLFNGNFATRPSGLPFDWQMASGSGVTVDIVPKPDGTGGRALMVDFQYGRVDYHSVSQLTMLTPGTYEFTGEYKGQLIGPRGLKWRVACAGQADGKLGESPTILGAAQNWTNISFTFTVPAADCRAQNVRLDLDARMASEQLVSGSMLFDALQISRVANPAAAGG